MISVVIPLYNKGNCVKGTIQSVLDQTFQQFEIVVVDDGSTDNSAAVVDSFNDKRIQLIKKENGGVCSARNRGIQEAKYDYVAFLDADDCFDKEYLAEQVKLINDFPEASMWGINFAELYDGKLIRELSTGLPKGFRGVVDGYFDKTLKNGRISDLFCSSSVVVRKSAFEIAGMFDERIKYAEDLDMWWRIIATFPVVFYDRYMVFYYYDAENRALHKTIPLDCYLPYFIDKYRQYREHTVFYAFSQRWAAIIDRRYFIHFKTMKVAKEASTHLDYDVLPSKYKFIFKTPIYIGWSILVLTEILKHLKWKNIVRLFQ